MYLCLFSSLPETKAILFSLPIMAAMERGGEGSTLTGSSTGLSEHINICYIQKTICTHPLHTIATKAAMIGC